MSFLKKILNFFFKEKTYADELEEYILSRNPQNTGDVERYALEYDSIRAGSKLI